MECVKLISLGPKQALGRSNKTVAQHSNQAGSAWYLHPFWSTPAGSAYSSKLSAGQGQRKGQKGAGRSREEQRANTRSRWGLGSKAKAPSLLHIKWKGCWAAKTKVLGRQGTHRQKKEGSRMTHVVCQHGTVLGEPQGNRHLPWREKDFDANAASKLQPAMVCRMKGAFGESRQQWGGREG